MAYWGSKSLTGYLIVFFLGWGVEEVFTVKGVLGFRVSFVGRCIGCAGHRLSWS